MKKTIYANESASIFLIALCVGNILATLLVSLVRGLPDFEGMNIMSWVTYALIQIMFVVSAVVYSAVRKINVPVVTRMNKGLRPVQYLLLPFIAVATILVFLPLANAWSAFLQVIHYHGAGVSMPATDKVWVYFLALFIIFVQVYPLKCLNSLISIGFLFIFGMASFKKAIHFFFCCIV